MLAVDPPLSYAEIAEQLGVPVGSIGPTRGRGLARLRQTAAIKSYVEAWTAFTAEEGGRDVLALGGPRHSSTGPASPWADDEALGAELIAALAERETYERVVASANGRSARPRHVRRRAGLEMDLLLSSSVRLHRARLARRCPRPLRRGLPTLVLEGHALGVEVEVESSSIEGQLLPATPGRVNLRTPRVSSRPSRPRRGIFRFDVTRRAAAAGVSSERGTCLTQWLPY